MKSNFLRLILILFTINFYGQSQKISIDKSSDGIRLIVDGKPFIVNGMNWDYVPIGNTITDSGIWNQSDDIVRAALDAEMSLLKNMGVNAIRTYNLKPKWITYIYDKYGIYTMLNITFGAYGLTINGGWVPETDYADPATKKVLMKEVTDMANTYKNTRGLLLYMIGNENNYHLVWKGAETEDIPIADKDNETRLAARALYRTYNDAVKLVKSIDSNHLVAICNGDLGFLDIVKEECKDIDVYGTNMYRGKTFTDAFQRVKNELNLPVLLTEFGADAYNARDGKEDQEMQAFYDVENWKDIYSNAAGLGKAGNALGGFTFQFSDGWWKYGQTKNLDVHDNNASWGNGGYSRDQASPSDNNMNEEWFGICAKGPTDSRGLYQLYPRAAYYALQEVHRLNPYDKGMSLNFINDYFGGINIMDAVLKARGDKAALKAEQGGKINLSQLRAEFTSFYTGGSLLTTPEIADPTNITYPNKTGFDFMHSYYIGVEGKPSDNMRANVNFNIIGRAAENPIDEIFYENRARPIADVNTSNGNVTLSDVNRINVYNAKFEWSAKDFDLRGFYRTGHYHWGYEGDFFGLYPEANYGPNLDIYGGETLGIEVDGKRSLKGLKVAAGPQLWWGANPAVLLKYSRKIAGVDVTGIYHRDVNTDLKFDASTGVRVLDENQLRSGVIPPWPTERATLVVEKKIGNVGVTVGGIWGGNPLNGTSFQDVRGTSGNYVVYTDKINSDDNWGAKAKITYQKGPFNWYAQGGVMGLVANGGADQTQTFTGWKLKDNGSGNQTNFLSGFTYSIGNFQVAPNFLWQKPIVGAMPQDVTGAGRLRNVLQDPFVVRANRETTAGEILFTYDPTPGTWMYAWDNDRAEDAKFAFNLGFVYKHLPTTQDAHIGFLADRSVFAFPTSTPAQDLWEVHSRVVSKLSPDLGFIANIYGGKAQANGDSQRSIDRFGTDVRVLYKKMKVMGAVKVNDWGPFDYHRDFNLTFPLQLMLDVSTSVGKQDWFILPSTKIGVRGTWRSLDQYSPRYSPNETLPFATSPIISPVGFDNGTEWEIRTYIHINLGK